MQDTIHQWIKMDECFDAGEKSFIVDDRTHTGEYHRLATLWVGIMTGIGNRQLEGR